MASRNRGFIDSRTNFRSDWNPRRIDWGFVTEWIRAMQDEAYTQCQDHLGVAPMKLPKSWSLLPTKFGSPYLQSPKKTYSRGDRVPKTIVQCESAKHCALGVGLDLYHRSHPENLDAYWLNDTSGTQEESPRAQLYYKWRGPIVRQYLDEEVNRVSGSYEEMPGLMHRYLGIPEYISDHLVDLNDSGGESLHDIAEYLISEFEPYADPGWAQELRDRGLKSKENAA